LETPSLGSPVRVSDENLTVSDIYYTVFTNSSQISGGVKIAARSYIVYQDADQNIYTLYSDTTYIKSTNRIKRDMAKELIADTTYTSEYDINDIGDSTVDIDTADVSHIWSFIKRNRAYYDAL